MAPKIMETVCEEEHGATRKTKPHDGGPVTRLFPSMESGVDRCRSHDKFLLSMVSLFSQGNCSSLRCSCCKGAPAISITCLCNAGDEVRSRKSFARTAEKCPNDIEMSLRRKCAIILS